MLIPKCPRLCYTDTKRMQKGEGMHMKEPYSAGAAAVGLRLRQQRLKRGWSQELSLIHI